MIILTLFGTTTGLELLPLPLANNIPPLKLEDAWVGVTPSQVTLQPEKDVFIVFRKVLSDQTITWIGLYRPAREMGYDRPGGFYGAGLWLINSVASAELVSQVLTAMANQIQASCMSGGRFVKKIAESKNEFTPPAQVSTLLSSLSKIGAGLGKAEADSVFVVENSSPSVVIDWAQRAPSAKSFSRVVIGEDNQTPISGSSSTFKIYPSLSFAIDASYQRLSADVGNLKQEISQTTKQLNQSVNELQNALHTLNNSENARRNLQQQVNMLKEDLRILNAQRAHSNNISAIGTRQSLPKAEDFPPPPPSSNGFQDQSHGYLTSQYIGNSDIWHENEEKQKLREKYRADINKILKGAIVIIGLLIGYIYADDIKKSSINLMKLLKGEGSNGAIVDQPSNKPKDSEVNPDNRPNYPEGQIK